MVAMPSRGERDGMKPIACRLDALTEVERERRARLASALALSMRRVEELPNGYDVEIDTAAPVTRTLPELVALERRCCPFLTLEIIPAGERTILNLTGEHASAKEFLRSEFISRGEKPGC